MERIQASEHENLRRYLERELERRCQKNPKYSLRAFARSLEVDCSYLSKILNGKRELSNRAVSSLAARLNFPEEMPLSLKELGGDPFSAVELDQFKLISDWYHYAILELINAKDFEPEVKWIAGQLGIAHGEALAAIERLKRLGLIVVDESGKWHCGKNLSTTRHRFSHTAFRNLQRQILEQAIEALEEVPMAERDQSSITMCVSKDRLDEAKERIKKFRRELMEFLEEGDSRDQVYQLSISLFPVSHRKRNG